MKPLLIGTVVAVLVGVVLAIYVSLTIFFAANAKALHADRKQFQIPSTEKGAEAVKKKQAHAG